MMCLTLGCVTLQASNDVSHSWLCHSSGQQWCVSLLAVSLFRPTMMCITLGCVTLQANIDVSHSWLCHYSGQQWRVSLLAVSHFRPTMMCLTLGCVTLQANSDVSYSWLCHSSGQQWCAASTTMCTRIAKTNKSLGLLFSQLALSVWLWSCI